MRLRWGSIHKKLSAMAHSVEFFSMCVCVLVGGEWRNLPLVVRVQPPTALPLNDLTQQPNHPFVSTLYLPSLPLLKLLSLYAWISFSCRFLSLLVFPWIFCRFLVFPFAVAWFFLSSAAHFPWGVCAWFFVSSQRFVSVFPASVIFINKFACQMTLFMVFL